MDFGDLSEDMVLTDALLRWQDGDEEAGSEAVEALFPYLVRVAGRMFRVGNVVEPSSVVQEAYLRLRGYRTPWASRKHFVRVAAKIMRRVMVDAFRARSAKRRSGGWASSDLGPDDLPASEPLLEDVVAVRQALETLERERPKWYEVVELRYFGGLSYKEISEVSGVNRRTAEHHWLMARQWLASRLGGGVDRTGVQLTSGDTG